MFLLLNIIILLTHIKHLTQKYIRSVYSYLKQSNISNIYVTQSGKTMQSYHLVNFALIFSLSNLIYNSFSRQYFNTNFIMYAENPEKFKTEDVYHPEDVHHSKILSLLYLSV